MVSSSAKRFVQNKATSIDELFHLQCQMQDDFIPSFWFGNVIFYFPLPEVVASLRLGSERGFTSHSHQAKSSHLLALFFFEVCISITKNIKLLILKVIPLEEYDRLNRQAGQAPCMNWLLVYSCLKTLFTITADVLSFTVIKPRPFLTRT